MVQSDLSARKQALVTRNMPCYSDSSMQLGTGNDEEDESKYPMLVFPSKNALAPAPGAGVVGK